MKLLLLCAALFAGCYHTSASYEPYRHMAQPEQIASEAAVLVDSDLKTIQEAGGIYIGHMYLDRETSFPAYDAGRFGATHMLLKDSKRDKFGDSHGNYQSSSTSQIYNLYRVPKENWGSLPEGLRPKP